MSPHENMFSSILEWLHDWISSYDAPLTLRDEYDLQTWMEEEMLEAIEIFLMNAFRKQKTRAQAIEILRAILWEFYVFQRAAYIESLVPSENVVQKLLAIPQTPQKTAAWYTEARELLTGHEFAGAVYGTPKAMEALVAKKCGAEVIMDSTNQETVIESRTVYQCPLNPFQWGWRFEQVIRQLFEQEIAQGAVDDTLGRIRHPTLPRLAASPDGLIVNGPRKGRLVEIKAPVSRVLKQEIPEEYYCQMQLQAEVTDVDAVEYIEVRMGLLTDYSSEEKFLEESCGSFPERMGVVLIVATSPEQTDTWKYAYSPIWPISPESLELAKEWMPTDMDESQCIVERSVWRVKQAWHTTVPRNKDWWNQIGFPAYKAFWSDVDAARADGRYKSKLLLVESDDE